MNDSVIAGALFDFMGWLTSRKERIVLSSADEASPAVDAIRDFAKMRGLSLDNAQVQTWQEALAQPEQKPVAFDPLPRACDLAGVDYQTFLKIKAYMPVAPQRTWVGLTKEERINISYKADGNECVAVELTEAKLKEKNFDRR